MPLPKIADAKNLSDQDLADAIVATKKELFELRLQKATGRMEKTHLFKHTRHRLSQLLTVETQRKAQQAQETATISQ